MTAYQSGRRTNERKTIKLLLLGDPAVGKTSLRKRYLGEGFKQNYMMTIGAEFAIKDVDKYRLQIWDLAGQKTLSGIRKNYYKGATGAIIVFDISRPQTFDNLQVWIDEMQHHFETIIPMIIVGNKADLRNNNSVSNSEAQAYARKLSDWSKYDVSYFESSALTGLNVDNLFERLVEEISIFLEMQM